MDFDLKKQLEDSTISSGQKVALYYIWFATKQCFWAAFFLGFFLSGPYQPFLWGMLAWIFALSAITTAAILRKATELDNDSEKNRGTWGVIKDAILGNIAWAVLVFIFAIIAHGTTLNSLVSKDSIVGQIISVIVQEQYSHSDPRETGAASSQEK